MLVISRLGIVFFKGRLEKEVTWKQLNTSSLRQFFGELLSLAASYPLGLHDKWSQSRATLRDLWVYQRTVVIASLVVWFQHEQSLSSMKQLQGCYLMKKKRPLAAVLAPSWYCFGTENPTSKRGRLVRKLLGDRCKTGSVQAPPADTSTSPRTKRTGVGSTPGTTMQTASEHTRRCFDSASDGIL